MFSIVSKKIDQISDRLEYLGFIKEAYVLDAISDTIENKPRMTRQQAEAVLLQIKQNPTLLAQLKNEIKSISSQKQNPDTIGQKEAVNSIVKAGILALMVLAPNILAQSSDTVDTKVDTVLEQVSQGKDSGSFIDLQTIKNIKSDVDRGNFHVIFKGADSTESKPVAKAIIDKFVKENPGKSMGKTNYGGKDCTVVFWSVWSTDFNAATQIARDAGLYVTFNPSNQLLVQVGSIAAGAHISF